MFRILVVDDEPWIRKGIISKIEQSGLDMKVVGDVNDGCEALKIINDARPDIIITDIRMPEIDGLQLVEKLRGRNSSMEIIVISGYAEFEYAKQAISMDVGSYLLKPIKASELCGALQKAADNLRKREEFTRVRTQQVLNKLIRQGNGILPKSDTALFLPECAVKFLGAVYLHYDGSLLTTDEIEKRNTLLQHELTDILSKFNNCIFCNYFGTPNEWFILVYAEERHKVELCLGKLAHQAFQALLKTLNLPVTVVISSIEKGMEFLPEIIRQCRKTINRRLLGGPNKIYYCSQTFQEGFNYPSSKLKALRECLKSGDLNNVKKLTVELFMSSEGVEPEAESLKVVFLHAINIFVGYCLEHHKDVMEFLEPEALTGEILSRFSNREAIAKYYFDRILKTAEMELNSAANGKSLVQRILAYVNEHIQEPITREDISQKFNITPNYFSRLFNEELKMGFSDYVAENRLEKAKELLHCSSINISEIAKVVGFRDVQYFWKVFKKHTGVTPLQFRQNKK